MRAPVLQLPSDLHANAERLLEKVLSVIGERKSGRDLPTNFKAVYSQLQVDDRSLAHELVLQLMALLSRPQVRASCTHTAVYDVLSGGWEVLSLGGGWGVGVGGNRAVGIGPPLGRGRSHELCGKGHMRPRARGLSQPPDACIPAPL